MSDINKNDFSFQIIQNVLYDIVWSGIEFIGSITARFLQNITITVDGLSTVKVADLDLTLENSISLLGQLLGSLGFPINITTQFVYTVNETGKIVFTNTLTSTFQIILDALVTGNASFAQSVALATTSILATFYLIVDYDPDALSTMDSQTLGALFYST